MTRRYRLPATRVSSVHRAAGAYNGDRPATAKRELVASWQATDKAVKSLLADDCKAGKFSVHFEDANRRGMTADDFHDDAVMLFADDPDYGVAVAPKGWKVDRAKTKHHTFPIGLESMHVGHFVTVTFTDGKREVKRTAAFGNIGRASSKGRAEQVWANFAKGARGADVVCVVEVQEGDSYNEREIVRREFPTKEWHRYFLRKSRNPILVRRRKGESIGRRISRLVGKPVARWSPPRRLNRVLIDSTK